MDVLNTLEIDKAYKRIRSFIEKTPLISNKSINEITGAKVYFKLENLQKTGSFKIRGAFNKISQLSDKEKSRGVVAFSSGNHAQAVAYVSKIFGIQATIVMPKSAPRIKILNTRKYGAKVILYEELKNNREDIASNIAVKNNQTIIKPYDDFDIIAGQGTIGKEIFDELKKNQIIPNIYLCCCGGGGLIAGSSLYLKKYFPKIKNYAVEPKEYNDTLLSLKKNKIIRNKDNAFSICDALLAPQPGDITFKINKYTLSAGLDVSDYEVKKAIKIIAEELKIKAEPGGAIAFAGLLSKKINIKNKTVIVMISGGNIDENFFLQILKNKYD